MLRLPLIIGAGLLAPIPCALRDPPNWGPNRAPKHLQTAPGHFGPRSISVFRARARALVRGIRRRSHTGPETPAGGLGAHRPPGGGPEAPRWGPQPPQGPQRARPKGPKGLAEPRHLRASGHRRSRTSRRPAPTEGRRAKPRASGRTQSQDQEGPRS